MSASSKPHASPSLTRAGPDFGDRSLRVEAQLNLYLCDPATAAGKIFELFKRYYRAELDTILKEAPDGIPASLPNKPELSRLFAAAASQGYHTLHRAGQQEAVCEALVRIIEAGPRDFNHWDYLQYIDSPELFVDVILYYLTHQTYLFWDYVYANRIALTDMKNYAFSSEEEPDVRRRFMGLQEKALYPGNGRFRPGVACSEFLAMRILLDPHFTDEKIIAEYLQSADSKFIERMVKAVVKLQITCGLISTEESIKTAKSFLPQQLQGTADKYVEEFRHLGIDDVRAKRRKG